MRCRVSGATVVTMTTSTPSPEDITPEEPGADELASADQVSHLPRSDTTLSPEHPIEGGDGARDAETPVRPNRMWRRPARSTSCPRRTPWRTPAVVTGSR